MVQFYSPQKADKNAILKHSLELDSLESNSKKKKKLIKSLTGRSQQDWILNVLQPCSLGSVLTTYWSLVSKPLSAHNKHDPILLSPKPEKTQPPPGGNVNMLL